MFSTYARLLEEGGARKVISVRLARYSRTPGEGCGVRDLTTDIIDTILVGVAGTRSKLHEMQPQS